MPRTVICVSHATGAGGLDFGRLVADRLGYRLVDEEIVSRAAESQNITVEELADVERRKSLLARILWDLGRGEVDLYGYGSEPSYSTASLTDPGSLRSLIRQSINETADEGDVVIVSHAASFALADRDDVLRVFVTASPTTRAARLAEAEGLDQKKAVASVEANDAGRADYLKRFYGVRAELPTHYDLVVNTDRIGTEQAAEFVVSAASP